MKTSAWIILIYAAIIFIGGMIGFKQAHSYPSLIAGSISALLLFLCALGMFNRSALAFTLALALIFALTIFFSYRFSLTTKFMPAGMMALVSLATLLVVFTQRKKKAKFI